MKSNRGFLIARGMVIVLLFLLIPAPSAGNAGPVVYVEEPAFSIMPGEDTAIRVEAEHLLIDLAQEGRFSAQITADYRMVHTGPDTVSQTMLFPYITSPSGSLPDAISILADGVPVPFEAYRLKDVPEMPASVHQAGGYERYLAAIRSISMAGLVQAVKNSPVDSAPVYLEEEAVVFTFGFPQKESGYEANLSFSADPRRHTVVISGFTGMSRDAGGGVSLSSWILGRADSRRMTDTWILVMGDTVFREEFAASEEITVRRETLTLEEVLRRSIRETALSDDPDNSEAMMAFAANRLEQLVGESRWMLSLEWDILESYFSTPYVGALLYTVEFSPGIPRNISVSYPVQASQDRSGTSRYTALMAYLLSPAAGWQDFKNLTVDIVPHPEQPYLLSSSLPLALDEGTGHYRGFFSELPQDDLVFRMYHRSEPETGLVKLFNDPYILLLVAPVVLVVSVLGTVVVVVMLALKKNKMDLSR